MAAASNVINDIVDLEIDKLNMPSRPIPSGKVHIQTAWLIYILLVATGGIIALVLSMLINKPFLFLIYPIATWLLWLYSKRLKNTVLVGNIVVSFFTAYTILIVLVAEYDIVIDDRLNPYLKLLVSFAVFAFFVNLVREVVKDLEDFTGDKKLGIRTLSTAFGPEKAKSVAKGMLVAMVSLIISWIISIFSFLDYRTIAYGLIFVVVPMILTLFRLHKADGKVQFGRVSTLLKYIMISGMVLFVMIIHSNLN
jgi:4-hydroxybenzoate polyprenyltransferase